MIEVAAFSILALTVSLSLSRPKIWRFRIHHSTAAVIGALLTVLFVIPLPLVLISLELLFFPIITIVSLMAITLIAEEAGLFQVLANSIARAAKGKANRLFAYLFFTGTLTGTIFTNDAAVLIFTPLVFNLIEEVKTPSWELKNKIPFYFAVLYVANLVGALVISNPINIIVSSIFKIRFVEYAEWMILPALVSIVVTFVGLKLYFRKSIPESYRLTDKVVAEPKYTRFMKITGSILVITLTGFFSENVTGIPTWVVASSGALVLLLLHRKTNHSTGFEIIRGIGWDVIIFVVGIFIVSVGLRNAGLTHQVGHLISKLAGTDIVHQMYTTGFVAAICSSIINNHPTADMMTWVIRDFPVEPLHTRMLVFSALIGGDLGPKMLPIGSLAALLWFRILRDKNVNIPYSLYIRIGIPVTLAAIFLSIVVLNLEYLFFKHFLA